MKLDITIIRNEEVTRQSIDLPDRWADIPFHKYIDLLDCKSDIAKMVSIFTAIDEDLVRKAQIHNLSQVVAGLNFLFTEIQYVLPDEILGYKIPKDLESESIAQYSDLQEILKEFKQDDPKHNLSKFPLIVATYCVKPYDFKIAEELQKIFFNAPCVEVMAVANFTLAKYTALNRGILPTSHPGDTLKTRLMLALRRWLINLDSTIRFYIWKKSLPISVQRFLNGR
jgi:hypothetical protein